MDILKISTRREEFENFDHPEFLASEPDLLTNLRRAAHIQDCTRMVAPGDYDADFIDRNGFSLAHSGCGDGA